MPLILLIGNDITRQSIIAEILTESGFKVSAAPDGRSGLAEFERVIPELVISDIHLPDLPGVSVIDCLRKKMRSVYIPIVLIAADKDFSLFRKALAAGADDLIPFPFSSSEFISAVNSLLKKYAVQKRHQLPRALKHHNNTLAPLLDPPAFSADEGTKMKNDDHFIINAGGTARVFKIGALKCITALGDYSAVFTVDSKFLVRKTMKEWLSILPSGAFIRIHRSTIINLAFVERIEKMLNRGYKVYIQNITKPFITSRRFSSGIRSKFI